MEYASEGDLSKIITLPECISFLKKSNKDYIKFIAANIILGLECLFKENVIYRDLKLENVLIF